MQKRIQIASINKDIIFVVLVLIVSIILLAAPSSFETPFGQNVVRVRGRVLETDNANIQRFGIVKTGEQGLRVRILSGKFKGQVVDATNVLLGKMETDKMFVAGDLAFLVVDVRGDEILATAYDHYRLHIELILLLLFAAFLVAFAGWGGLKALLSFAFAVLLIWKVLLPGILLEHDPILIAMGVVTVMTAATLYLVAGVNKTAHVALLGSLLGIMLTIALAMLLLPPFRLHGAIQPFSETLLYSGKEALNLTRIFIAAVFIGASGAVLDVAIDVSTAMNEVVEKRPDLSRRALIKSGFVVGRNMTSTMVTTLLMAYASGYMALLMVFMVQGVQPVYLLNTNYVAAEILKTVVGSFGLVTVAPFTALVGGVIYAGGTADPGPAPSCAFTVAASRCALRPGEAVAPETVIGEDSETGETIYARCRGYVEHIAFNAGDHTLAVVVRPASQASE